MQTWTDVRDTAAGLAGAFDASRISVAEAERLVPVLTTLGNIVSAMLAQAAARVAESDRWRGSGAKTPAEHLARRTGVSLGQARTTLTTGRRLAAQPHVQRAASAGELSPSAVAAISDAAEADPAAQERLVERARTAPFADLRRECLATKAAADPDPDATRRRIHAARRFRQFVDPEGAAHTILRGLPEDAAEIRSLLAPAREELFRSARRNGHVVSSDTLDYDAVLLTLRRGAGRADTPADPARRWAAAKIIVRIDESALRRGQATADEVCDVDGAPVTPAAVHEFVAGGASVAAVATRPDGLVTKVVHLGRHPRVDLRDPDAVPTALSARGVDVAGVASGRRRAGAHVRTALEWLYPGCADIACTRAARLEINHQRPWSETRRTILDDLDRLCDYHHYLHTRHGWRLVPGVGRRLFVSPDDPRHPGHSPQPGKHARAGPAPP